ncbi:Uncharacterised protein [Candidatus Anstonella stagnisolia]|nr:Uncharacterised protein [Candidatus Anstonella stagnisolia]
MGYADLAESSWKIVLAVGVLSAAALAAAAATGTRSIQTTEMVMVVVVFLLGMSLKHEAQLLRLGEKKVAGKKRK